MIYLTSDFHFAHNMDFIYKARGFENIDQMNKAVVENINNTLKEDDELYVLGDLVLDDFDEGYRYLKMIKPKMHIILGNHDTDKKVEAYRKLENVVSGSFAEAITYKRKRFFLCHYPVILDDGNSENPDIRDWCLHGHTHSRKKYQFLNCYNIGLDAHKCYPVSIEQVYNDIKNHKNNSPE